MTDVPAREPRNDVSSVLRRVEPGERLRVTVSGRPGAELVPLATRAPTMGWDDLQRRLENRRADVGLTAQLVELLTETTNDVPIR